VKFIGCGKFSQTSSAAVLVLIVASGTLHAQSTASPRVSLQLQKGFFNGAEALYITPEMGVDPNAPPSVIATAKQIATAFNANLIPQLGWSFRSHEVAGRECGSALKT
jgi:hypothetical protein